jgi:hypothetical protein
MKHNDIIPRSMAMKGSILLATALLFSGTFASEIVSKSSAQFTFPTQATAVRWNPGLAKTGAFTLRNLGAGSRSVEFSWALPGSARSGSIGIFNLAGVCVKSFPVNASAGSVLWNSSGSVRAGKGVYFARFTYGTFKKSLKLIIF